MTDDRARGAPVRQRRRETAVREIIAAAERQVVERGPAGLALRAVARSLGMTVQALYHYFPSRDELLTALITEAYEDLAAAVQAAADRRHGDHLPRLVRAAEGYRHWAVDNPELFQLIYGTPLRDYEAPVDGRTTEAVRQMSAVFRQELFAGFSASQLAEVDVPPLSRELRTHLDGLPPDALGSLPPGAAALFLSAWGHMHGLVVLEVFGHLAFVGPSRAELFRSAMLAMLVDVHRRVPSAPVPAGA